MIKKSGGGLKPSPDTSGRRRQPGDAVCILSIPESGKRIKEMRKKAGMTQAELAEKFGISADGMSRVERGKNGVSVDLFGVMAELLGSSVDYLAYEVQTMVLTEQEMRVIMAMRGII